MYRFPGFGLGGGEIQLPTLQRPGHTDQAAQAARLADAGRPADGAGVTYDYYRWYRVVRGRHSSRRRRRTRTTYVTLAGPTGTPNTSPTQAWLFDGVIAVYEKNMHLEFE